MDTQTLLHRHDGVDAVFKRFDTRHQHVRLDIVGGSASWSYYVTNGTTKKLDQLLPGGSGWSNLSAIRMNDNGCIIGFGWLAGEPHGYMLTPTYGIAVRETLVAQIPWGMY